MSGARAFTKVVFFKREKINQAEETSLRFHLPNDETEITCFTVSECNGYLVAGDNQGNIYVASQAGRSYEWIINESCLSGSINEIQCIDDSLIAVGTNRDEQPEIAVFSFGRRKKTDFRLLQQKDRLQLKIQGSITSFTITESHAIVGSDAGDIEVIRLPKLRHLFQTSLLSLNEEQPTPLAVKWIGKVNPPAYLDLGVVWVLGEDEHGSIRRTTLLAFAKQGTAHTLADYGSHQDEHTEARHGLVAVVDNGDLLYVNPPLGTLEQLVVAWPSDGEVFNLRRFEKIEIIRKVLFRFSTAFTEGPAATQLLLGRNSIMVILFGDNARVVDLKRRRLLLDVVGIPPVFVSLTSQASSSADSSSPSFLLLGRSSTELSLTLLRPLDLEARIEALIRTKMFVEALELATDSGSRAMPKHRVAFVRRKHADELFRAGKYDDACDQYIQTIGLVEASHVVRKFLEASLVRQLARYLYALHEMEKADAPHTTLLINCYAKLGDREAVRQFVERAEKAAADGRPPHFDTKTAIQVCQAADFAPFALRLAASLGEEPLAFKALAEDGAWNEALALLEVLPLEDSTACLERHAAGLLLADSDVSSRTTELCIQLCTSHKPAPYASLKAITADWARVIAAREGRAESGGRVSPDRFLHLFTGPELEHLLLRFLSAVADAALSADRPEVPLTGPGCLTSTVWHTYLELLLRAQSRLVEKQTAANEQETPAADADAATEDAAEEEEEEKPVDVDPFARKGEGDDDGETAIKVGETRLMSLLDRLYELQESTGEDDTEVSYFDADHALVLCRAYGFHPGLLYLYDRKAMYAEIIRHHVTRGDTPRVLETFQRYRSEVPGLWQEVLSCTVRASDEDAVQRVLNLIELQHDVSPVQVVSILAGGGEGATLSLVCDFFQKKLNGVASSLRECYETTRGYETQISRLEEDLEKLLRPHTWERGQCRSPACQSPKLEVPIVYFRCGHGYHQRCVRGDHKCPLCAKESLESGPGVKVSAEELSKVLEDARSFSDIVGLLSKDPFRVIGLGGQSE